MHGGCVPPRIAAKKPEGGEGGAFIALTAQFGYHRVIRNMNDGVTGAHENAKYQGVSKLQPVSSDSAPSINQPTLTRAASLRTTTAIHRAIGTR